MRKIRIWVLTLFPEYFNPLLEFGVAASALKGERGREFEFHTVNLRHFSPNDYKGVDDTPYGGGAGMVMRADVLKNALVEGIAKPQGFGEENLKDHLHIIYPSPRGKKWSDALCRQSAKQWWGEDSQKDVVFICGRYEGIDERFIELYVDQQISLGDYILTGGEVAVMTILDSALRFVPGTLGNKESAEFESFSDDLLEYPHYTKPRVFEGLEVPEVLLSGHHQKIEEYREHERVRLTKAHRPDLLGKMGKKGSTK